MSEDDHTSNLSSSLAAIKRLLPMAGRQLPYLPLALCLLAVKAVVQLLLPQIMRIAIDGTLIPTAGLNHAQKLGALQNLGILCVGFLILGSAANYLSTWYLQKFGQSLVLTLKDELFAKLHRLPITYFDTHATGRTVTRVVNDSKSLSELFTNVLAAGLGDVILFAGIFAVLIFTDPILTGILFLFCPLLIGLVVWFRARSAVLYKTQRTLLAKINAFFSENLEGLGTIKSFQAENYQTERFNELNHEYLQNELGLISLVARFRPGFAVARMFATGLMLTLGGYFVVQETSTIGTLISSLLYIKLLFSPLEQLADRYNILIRATVASERVLAILDLKEERVNPTSPIPLNKRISFEDVSFHYNANKPVLKNVTFSLEPGETIALVGPTGSGKSTIMALLLGFYPLDPSQGHQGQILIDGVSLSEMNLQNWRRTLAFVSQELFLFKGTLAQNVSLSQKITGSKIEESLQQADCSNFVSELPKGSQTVIGEKSNALSTGQRQLLSFARALAFEPELLLLDEATANIDSETESKVEKALDILLQNRQAVIVAHRLSTVKRADKIIVLSQGTVVESGNHHDLLEQKGLYASMVHQVQEKKTPTLRSKKND